MENKNISPSDLCEMAIKARLDAYAPYSDCHVGAALLTKQGKVYLGCNIENASYTPTVCAERVAFFKAVSAGERDFKAIAVAGTSDDKIHGLFPPCGVCRQVMAEFCDRETFKIYMVKSESEHIEVTLKELLPYGFDKDNLN